MTMESPSDVEAIPPSSSLDDVNESSASECETESTQRRAKLCERKRTMIALTTIFAIVVVVAVPLSIRSKPAVDVEKVTSPEMSANEKVEYDSESSPIVSTYQGPMSGFWMTGDVARIQVSSANGCAENEALWKFNLETDNYPWETAWELKNSAGRRIASGPPAGQNYARRTKYTGSMCLPVGDYVLTMKDKMGDGICCTYGPGKFSVLVDGKVLVTSDDSDYKAKNYPFKVSSSSLAPKPTKKPTAKPTPKPTNSDLIPGSECTENKVEIELTTDNVGKETGLTFNSKPKNGSKAKEYLKYEVGSLTGNT